MRFPSAGATTTPAVDAAEAFREARERTLALVASVSDDDLERVHSTLMSPLVWDLGHIAAFETPRAGRGELEFLRPDAAIDYLADVRATMLEVIDERGIGDGLVHEMVLRHEQQHNETMLQTLQLACLRDYEPVGRVSAPAGPGLPLTGLELIEIPAGPCTIGAPAWGFAYDNERPRHRTDVREYLIGQAPITNATYLTFVEGGGYERREWWSAEGWSWKEQYDITRPGSWTADLSAEWRLGSLEPLAAERPVVHISWFEADAFARAHGVRLPTEFEWEKAATWDQQQGRVRSYPWGDQPPVPGVHANVDQLGCGPAPAGAYPAGHSPYGCVGMIGDVWEWTSSEFAGYPGFAAYPYREYSQVFFDGAYKVLRGGSWATRARVATPTFRNWDHPQRRQIFSGLRIAKDPPQ
jgi:iron(II)-dependent oxidoreductase